MTRLLKTSILAIALLLPSLAPAEPVTPYVCTAAGSSGNQCQLSPLGVAGTGNGGAAAVPMPIGVYQGSMINFLDPAAGRPSNGDTGGNSLLVTPEMFNGSTWDQQRTNMDTGALVTLTVQTAGTVNSADQTNYNSRGVKCVFDQTAHTGTPSTTFAIQFKDTTSGTYTSYVTSAAITADATPTQLTVYPGITATANASVSDILTRTWRVAATVGGTTPAVTATIGCSVIN